MYNVGDKVVYPMHGAGVIEAIEEKRILGENHKYYILKMPIKDMKVMIPVDNIVGIGIRPVVSKDEADLVIGMFQSCDEDDNGNWNKRYRENIFRLKTGSLEDVAYVTKTLIMRNEKKNLSNAERKMLNNSKNILISELILSKNMTYDEVETLLFGN